MVSTRSASSSPVKKVTLPAEAKPKASSARHEKTTLPTAEALRLVVAPKGVSSNARFLTLSNPADDKPKRFLFCSKTGLYELTAIEVPKHEPRSVLFAPCEENGQATSGSISNGYINKIATYVTATPCDLAFILLPIASSSSKSALFQSLDDLLETDSDTYNLDYVIQNGKDRAECAMESICDMIEAGDEKMFRYSQDRTLNMITAKARRACENGLPATMEEKFVTRALEAPILSVKREESTISIAKTESQEPADSTSTPPPFESHDSQSSTTSTAPSVVFSEASMATSTTSVTATSLSESPVPETVRSLQRFLTAFKFICASYLPPAIAVSLQAVLESPKSPIDLTALTAYTANLAKLRAEAAASADLSSFSRKRGSLEDEEEAEARAEKRRRLEEEEKRKRANTSRGVKELAKVDTKGMKKMSSFFTKVAVKKQNVKVAGVSNAIRHLCAKLTVSLPF